MFDNFTDPDEELKQLRSKATALLKQGSAPPSKAGFSSSSIEALGVLFRLSSSPETASDGLKLLHELQTYQVELDMQLEQLQANERDYNHELACYRTLYKMSPNACFILNPNGIIKDCNEAAIRLFYGQKEDLCGRPVNSLMTPASRPMLDAMLARARNGHEGTALIVTADTQDSDIRKLRLRTNLSADREALLMMVAEYEQTGPA